MDGRMKHADAIEKYDWAVDAWSDNRNSAKEDIKFRNLDQWPDNVKQKRDKKKRPCLVVDKLGQYIRQVVNDGRQNRPAIKYSPVDDKSDPKVAEALTGITRNILSQSCADDAFDTALDCAATGGYGFFRVCTDYEGENTFNQEIKIKRVKNPLSVILYPGFQHADGSDADGAFIVDEISKESFKSQYPKAKHVDFKAEDYKEEWVGDTKVRICEHFYKVYEDEEVHLLKDGTVVFDSEYKKAVTDGVMPPKIEKTRKAKRCKIKWQKLSGAEVLEEGDWAGKYVPVPLVIGNEIDVEGKTYYSGMIRQGKDAQRLYNYSRSAYAERVALAPKAPFIAAAGQVEQYSDDWEAANEESFAVLRYDPVDVAGQQVPPPIRQQASDIPEGFARDAAMAEHDIQAALGMYQSDVGQQGNERSGKAILARQRAGDTGTFHYHDNLNRAIRFLGMILVDLIPKIYDTKRVVRILGEDGAQKLIQLDPEMQRPYAEMAGMPIYNLGIGKFDVVIDSGPSYTTKRQEAVDVLMELSKGNPDLFKIAGDEIFRNMDWSGADVIAKRMKMLLPPEISQMEENQAIPPEVQVILAQAEQQLNEVKAQFEEAAKEFKAKDAEFTKVQSENYTLKAKLQATQEKSDILQAEKDLKASEEIALANIDKAELEFELKIEKGERALENIVDNALNQIRALTEAKEPKPDAENPQEEAKEGPNPDILAILNAMQQNTEAIFAEFRRPRTKKATMPDGREIVMTEQ